MWPQFDEKTGDHCPTRQFARRPDIDTLVCRINRYAGLPYQHRLLDALMKVKLGTLILVQDLSVSFDPRVGFECQTLVSAGYLCLLRAQRGEPIQRDVDGDAAVYVKPNDVRDYAEAIASLLDDEDNRAGSGVSTSSRNLPGVIRNVAYRGVYQRLTGGPQGPRPACEV